MEPRGNKIGIDLLRDVAWTCWDPLGLAENRAAIADKYDAWMMQAAGMAIRGLGEDEIADFLSASAQELGATPDEQASSNTAAAILRVAPEAS